MKDLIYHKVINFINGPRIRLHVFFWMSVILGYVLVQPYLLNKLGFVFFKKEFNKRLLTLFGSTEEAAIEYNLVRAIVNKQISTPTDLDSVTFLTGNNYSDYERKPWFKGLWMLLETDYKAPLHNLNDMLANLLAIHYFRQYLYNREEFSPRYMAFLKNGYNAPPSELLKKFMKINISDENFTKEALEFIKQETKQ